jgi:hypothetical protein
MHWILHQSFARRWSNISWWHCRFSRGKFYRELCNLYRRCQLHHKTNKTWDRSIERYTKNLRCHLGTHTKSGMERNISITDATSKSNKNLISQTLQSEVITQKRKTQFMIDEIGWNTGSGGKNPHNRTERMQRCRCQVSKNEIVRSPEGNSNLISLTSSSWWNHQLSTLQLN